MIRGTDRKRKFKHLKRDLDLPEYAVKGLLQGLWDFCAENTPRGDIGRFTNEDIALDLEWEGDPDVLIAVLAKRHWLDVHEDPEIRLVVHEWSTYCETWVHLRLARATEYFIDGAMPKITKLAKTERIPIMDKYAEKPICAQDGHAVRTAGALPIPEPIPEPSQIHADKGKRTASPEKGTGSTVKPFRRVDTEPTGLTSEALSDVIDGMKTSNGAGSCFSVALASRVMAISGEPEFYMQWWECVVDRMNSHGGLEVFLEALEWAEKSCDPAQRRAKDIGEMTHPGRYITVKCQEYLTSRGVKLPPIPVAEEAAAGPGAITP